MSVETQAPESEARFAAVGDMFLGDQPVCLGFGVRSLAERAGYASLFQDVKEIFARYELVVANLETIISSRDAVVSSKCAARVDRADPEAAAAIRDAGIRLVGLANNHIFEYGEEGLNQTTKHLQACGIAWVGKNNYRIERIAGKDVAFLSWSLLPDTYWPELDAAAHYNVAKDVTPILEEVNRAKRSADYVVLLLHWGNEFINRPSRRQQETGHALIDAGADIVLGHHSHVLQSIERYKGGLIAYSLGNFIIDSWDTTSQTTVILEIILGKPIEYRAIPVHIDRRRYVPRPVYDEAEKAKTLSILVQHEPMEESAYRKAVYDKRMRHRLSSVMHFVRNVHRVGFRNLAWALAWGLRRIVFLARVAHMEKKDPDVVYRGPMH